MPHPVKQLNGHGSPTPSTAGNRSRTSSKQVEARWEPAFAMLIRNINGRRPRFKEVAIIMLGELHDDRAVQPLLELLSREQRTRLRGRVVTALGRIGGKESRSTLRAIMKSENEREWVRACARAALGLKESYRSSRIQDRYHERRLPDPPGRAAISSDAPRLSVDRPDSP